MKINKVLSEVGVLWHRPVRMSLAFFTCYPIQDTWIVKKCRELDKTKHSLIKPRPHCHGSGPGTSCCPWIAKIKPVLDMFLVTPGCIKHFKTWGLFAGSSRINRIHPEFSWTFTVLSGLYSRFHTVSLHSSGPYRGTNPGLWERGLSFNEKVSRIVEVIAKQSSVQQYVYSRERPKPEMISGQINILVLFFLWLFKCCCLINKLRSGRH